MQQWHQTNDKQWVYADETGKILSKVIFKHDYWGFNSADYLTIEQAKASVEASVKKELDALWLG